MYEILCQEELLEVLKKIKFVAGMSLNSGSDLDTKYGWTNYHTTINYKGELIDVKSPKLVGRFGLAIGRFIVDLLFNDFCTVYEDPSISMEREANLYKTLFKAGFPTFEPRQNLILDQDGKPYVTGVLLTKKVIKPKHTLDLIKKADEIKALDYISNISELMRSLHIEHKVVWADARLENTLYDNNERLLLYDFGFKPNPNKPLEFLQGKDLVSLCLSVVSTGQDPSKVIPVILDSYKPSDEVGAYLSASLETEIKDQSIGLMEKIQDVILKGIPEVIQEALYFQPLFRLTNSQVIATKKEICKRLS